MFDIGWSELVVIGVVALIVIGPKELPGVLRMCGQWIGKVRRMASDFQGQFQEAMREAEMADLKKQVDDIADSTRDLTANFDPIGSMQESLDDTFAETTKSIEAGRTDAPAELASGDEGASAPPPVPVAPSPSVDDAAADAIAPPQKAAGGHSA
jgi:sec-independent protein translocase protein TatB